MLDVRGIEVFIGDKVWIAYDKNLYEVEFVKETKNSFVLKANGAIRGYSLPKNKYEFNMVKRRTPNRTDAEWVIWDSMPTYITTDISDKPYTRIIKID